MISSSLRVLESVRPSPGQRFRSTKTRIVLCIAAVLLIAVFSVFAETVRASWADRTLKTLSLRDKIAQLIQIRVPGKFLNTRSDEFQSIQAEIQKNHVGGVVLFAGNIYESALLLNNLQDISGIPLLVSADFERGVSFRIADTTSFPWTMALGAAGSEEFAYEQGLVTARESRALGVHWIFAPVLDVNNNPDNPVINIRSFGEDPALVSRLGAAFIRGAKKGGVLTTAKHFPGHGDTATDTHIGLAVVQSDLKRLESIELAPFRSAIEAGVDSIMTAHVAVPKITGDAKLPATVSSKILTGLLRDSLGFGGLVVTDAMEMGGITNAYWGGAAAVRAIQAGADVVLLPPDTTVAINEIERAVRRGDISVNRIDASVRKILSAKSRLGLLRQRAVDISRIRDVVASPQSIKLAQDIADRSITVVRDEPQRLPVDPTGYPKVFSIALTPDLESNPASKFQFEMRRRFPLIRTLWANARISDDLLAAIDKAVSETDLIVCSTLVRLVSGQTASPLPPNQRIIVDKLIASRKPLIWISFGNPYVIQLAPGIGTYVCTFSYSDVSQEAAAKAISGEIETTGRLPVSIPGFAKTGEGKSIPRLDMTLRDSTAEEPALPRVDFSEPARLLDSMIESGAFPGAVLMLGRRGEILFHHAAGRTRPSEDAPIVAPDTRFEVASMGKAMEVASAILLAADSNRLLLNATVTDYAPEMKGTAAGKLRLVDLLKTSGNEDLLKTIATRTAGMPWERFLDEQLFIPLGMAHAVKPQRILSKPGKNPVDLPKPARTYRARDLAVFAQMILNRGVYNHRRYFSLDAVRRLSGFRGPWDKPSDSDWTGKLFSSSAFGHISGTGSLLWIDPEKELFIILLANGDPNGEKTGDAQRKLCESIIAAIPN